MNKLINYANRLALRNIPLKNKFCCLCSQSIGGFLPYKGGWKAAPPLMAALNMIGSDLDNFSCPACNSHDRERHLWLYLQASGLLNQMQGSSILHFAPELHLSQKIIQTKPEQYVKADLHPTAPDIKCIDLLGIPYPDATFDFILANHVLEHVQDDNKALAEINRVLKPNSWAILQTPYAENLQQTWEDSGIQTEHQRLFAYGQEDHVRLYGKDIFQRISKSGLKPHIKYHQECLPKKPSSYYGVNVYEPFMLFRN